MEQQSTTATSRSLRHRKRRARLRRRGAPSCTLTVKVGRLRLETWEYRYSRKKPYARLRVEDSSILQEDSLQGESIGDRAFEVMLDPSHAWAVAVALVSWFNLWHDMMFTDERASEAASMSATFGTLKLTLHGRRVTENNPTADVSVSLYHGLIERTASLTPLEAVMVSDALFSIVEDE